MNWKRGKRGNHANRLTGWGSWGKIRRERELAKDARWQALESEVDEHGARGEVMPYENSEALLASLDEIASRDPLPRIFPGAKPLNLRDECERGHIPGLLDEDAP